MTMAIKGKRILYKTLEDKLTFGHHNGQSIDEVLKKDKQYIIWMHNNTNHKLGKRLIKIVDDLYNIKNELK